MEPIYQCMANYKIYTGIININNNKMMHIFYLSLNFRKQSLIRRNTQYCCFELTGVFSRKIKNSGRKYNCSFHFILPTYIFSKSHNIFYLPLVSFWELRFLKNGQSQVCALPLAVEGRTIIKTFVAAESLHRHISYNVDHGENMMITSTGWLLQKDIVWEILCLWFMIRPHGDMLEMYV